MTTSNLVLEVVDTRVIYFNKLLRLEIDKSKVVGLTFQNYKKTFTLLTILLLKFKACVLRYVQLVKILPYGQVPNY